MVEKTFVRFGHPLSTIRPTLHNGPGRRLNYWFQGCSIRCTKECLNPQYLSPKGGYEFSIEEVMEAADRIVKLYHQPVEGVTFLGGEPTDQLPALVALLESFQAMELSTMVYTGHRLEDIHQWETPWAERLLKATDIIVDGPYEAECYDDRLSWRGSTNQGLHCLSKRYTPQYLESAYNRQKKSFSIEVRQDGSVSISGIQNRKSASVLEKYIDLD